MHRFILCPIAISFALSYSSNQNLNKPDKFIRFVDTIDCKTKNGIRFDFRAELNDVTTKNFIIHATLYNDDIDTAYFLSTTCEGEPHSLRYDTSKFEQTALRICNVSRPVIIKIAPKGQHDFRAYFRMKDEATKMQLGFDFHAVAPAFDLKDQKTGSINIFHRPNEEQNMIWSGEKSLR